MVIGGIVKQSRLSKRMQVAVEDAVSFSGVTSTMSKARVKLKNTRNS
jgi:hypothetical protein